MVSQKQRKPVAQSAKQGSVDSQQLLDTIFEAVRAGVEAIETKRRGRSHAPHRPSSTNGCTSKTNPHWEYVRFEPNTHAATHILCVVSDNRLPEQQRKSLISRLEKESFIPTKLTLHVTCGCFTFEVHPR